MKNKTGKGKEPQENKMRRLYFEYFSINLSLRVFSVLSAATVSSTQAKLVANSKTKNKARQNKGIEELLPWENRCGNMATYLPHVFEKNITHEPQASTQSRASHVHGKDISPFSEIRTI